MSRKRSLLLCGASLLLLPSCFRTKKADADDLRSQLAQGVSLASESEMFLGYVEQGRTPRYFAQAHLDYLSQQAHRETKELEDSASSESIGDKQQAFIKSLASLAQALTTAREEAGDPQGLAHIRTRIASIRRQLEEAQASL